MSRKTVVPVACAALVGALALVTGTSAQSPGPPSGTIELLQRDRDARSGFVDNPPRRKESAGDVFVIAGNVRNPDGRIAGRASVAFTQTDARHAVGSAVFKLADGQVVLSGVLDQTGESDTSDTLAIVGGTGAYAGARGTATVTEEQGATRFTLSLGG